MTKLKTFLFLFLLLGLGFILFQNSLGNQQYRDFEIVTYTLNNKQYRFLLADTPEKWEKGLMNYRELRGVDGMLFRFPDEQIRSFWNKNTLMDLDVYWIKNGNTVGKGFLPSIDPDSIGIDKRKEQVIITSPQAINEVVELPIISSKPLFPGGFLFR